MRLLWATRGRDWGFRFLRDDLPGDPLPTYERAFEGTGDESGVWRVDADTVAVRVLDPEDRRDRAGRAIPHEIVIFGPPADRIVTVDDFLLAAWPTIADDYSAVWDSPEPPS